MRRGIVSIVAVLTLVVVASSAFALEIRVAPQTLVLSSGGGKLTVHTDVPFRADNDASLAVNGTPVQVYTFPDSCGRLVAQCTKSAVAGILGDFDGKKTTATIELAVYGQDDAEDIVVKK